MDLYSSIKKRKSCRDYTKDQLSKEQLGEIEKAIASFVPLYADVPIDYRFVTKTKGMFKADAPHYLIISGQGKSGEAENAGFIFEQLTLWFDAMDIGSVWLGEAKDAEHSQNKNDIITIAFGKTNSSVHRSLDQFKRKPIQEFTNAPDEPCIQAAHLAPSGMNLQPWYFEKSGERVILYKKILKPPVSLAYKKVDIDMGIALCHYMLACKHIDKPFVFNRKAEGTAKNGYKLFGELG